MPKLLQYFRRSPDIIPSFGFTEFTSGRGVSTFYCGETNDSTYTLTSNVFSTDTDNIFYTTTAARSTDGIVADVDYDSEPMHIPRVIDGKVIVEVTGAVYNPIASAKTISHYFKVYLRKWDGTTETEIANSSSTTFSNSVGATSTDWSQHCVEMNVTNTLFNYGEKIRITIEMHGWGSDGSVLRYSFGHDPSDKNSSLFPEYYPDAASSVLKVFLPFRIVS